MCLHVLIMCLHVLIMCLHVLIMCLHVLRRHYLLRQPQKSDSRLNHEKCGAVLHS